MKVEIVILAAGKGTRMRSSLPKVLHEVAGKPLLGHVLDAGKSLASDIRVVVGHGADQVKEKVAGEHIHFVTQTEQLGTGHAVLQAMPNVADDSTVLVLYGDVPLIQTHTLEAMLDSVNSKTLSLLTVVLPDPSGYGRIIRNKKQEIIAITEHKDASAEELSIKEVNTGILAVKANQLKKWLPELSNSNTQGEYYLTDIIAKANEDNVKVMGFHPQYTEETLGVNSKLELAEIERLFQDKTAKELLTQGVTLIDPKRFDCRGELTIGEDVVIDINVIIEGKVEIGSNVKIGANAIISNSSIGNNVEILPNSLIDQAVIGNECSIGPFARIRPATRLEDGVKIGNFVETKKSNIGKGSKVNHLTYIGDAEIGESSNIGAGTITCNYDGVNKSKTIIGDDVFIGSNASLVAPVNIADGVTVGAGSTITKSINKDHLAIARGKQRNITGWERPKKK